MPNRFRNFKKKLSCCKSLDQYGTAASFQYKGSNSYQTYFGVCVTLATTAILIHCSIFISTGYQDTTSPSIEYKEFRYEKNLSGDMMAKKMNFFITVQNTYTSNFYSIDDLQNSFDLKSRLFESTIEINPDGSSTSINQPTKNINIKPCKDVKWYQNQEKSLWPEKMTSVYDNYGFCFDTENLPVKWIDNNLTGFDFFIDPCSKPNCTNTISPSQLLINVIMLEPVFDLENKYKPIRIAMNDKNQFNTNQNSSKSIKMYLKAISVSSQLSPFSSHGREAAYDDGFGLERFEVMSFDRVYPNNDSYLKLSIVSSNLCIDIQRNYKTFVNVLGEIGGILEILGWFATCVYGTYSAYFLNKDLIVNVLMGDDKNWPKNYKFREDYNKIKCIGNLKCCCKKNYSKFHEKKMNVDACDKILEERLDIVNYIKDSMEFQIIKRLLQKARHQIQIPQLSVSLARNNLEDKKIELSGNKQDTKPTQENQQSEIEVQGTIEDNQNIKMAYRQLSQNLHENKIEKVVDSFFLDNQVDDSFFLDNQPNDVVKQNSLNKIQPQSKKKYFDDDVKFDIPEEGIHELKGVYNRSESKKGDQYVIYVKDNNKNKRTQHIV